MAQIRSRHWNVVLNRSVLEIFNIEDKLALSGLRYAYIYHNDEEKQRHIHLVLDFDNARSFESIQKTFPGGHIEKVVSLSGSIQYLTHKNNPEKEQYSFEDIKTNSELWLKGLYGKVVTTYINDEEILISEIEFGNYEDMYDIITSRKYSMEWLQRRFKIVELLLLGSRAKIIKKNRKAASEFFGSD